MFYSFLSRLEKDAPTIKKNKFIPGCINKILEYKYMQVVIKYIMLQISKETLTDEWIANKTKIYNQRQGNSISIRS